MRFILFATNFIITVVGIAILAIGGVALAHLEELQAIFADTATYLSIGLLAVGLLIILLGITGICGACLRGSKVCIKIHVVMLLALILIEVVLAVMVFYYAGDEVLEQTIDETVEDAFHAYGKNTTGGEIINEGIDLMQVLLGCCGKTNYTDWSNGSVAFTWVVTLNMGAYYPDSCCIEETEQCGLNVTNITTHINQEGCETMIYNWMDEWFYTIAAIVLVIAVLQILNLIFSCCLSKKEDD